MRRPASGWRLSMIGELAITAAEHADASAKFALHASPADRARERAHRRIAEHGIGKVMPKRAMRSVMRSTVSVMISRRSRS